MTNDYEYQLLKKAQEQLVLMGKIENRDCDVFDHPQLNSIEELAKELDELLVFLANERTKHINQTKENK